MERMNLDEILSRLQQLQGELEQEIDQLLAQKRKQFHYTLRKGRVRFEREMRRIQRRQKVGLWRYLRDARVRHLLSAPVIYSVFPAFLFMDLMVSLYQWVCFPLYGIQRVSRRSHIAIDRHQLAYLNAIEKINCVYCGYGNGVIEYAREVSGRTEQYWCPIKHARRTRDPHRYHDHFVDYGDAEAYHKELQRLRARIRRIEAERGTISEQ